MKREQIEQMLLFCFSKIYHTLGVSALCLFRLIRNYKVFNIDLIVSWVWVVLICVNAWYLSIKLFWYYAKVPCKLQFTVTTLVGSLVDGIRISARSLLNRWFKFGCIFSVLYPSLSLLCPYEIHLIRRLFIGAIALS